ncbi:MAG TPA: tetratricopeptide repeat protein [Casimicrobiaceae bacterium]|nr:tetratricopeptide repeat protein [Casimicrobiaceae bacterium]
MTYRRTRLTLAIIVSTMATALGAQPLPAPSEAPQASVQPGPASPPTGIAPDIFYRMMLGEVALQRGEPALAARAFLDAARESRDAKIARRAAEVAWMTRQRGLAEQAAKLWLEIDASAERPKQILAAIASGTGFRNNEESTGESELRARLERFLADAALSGSGVGEPFLQLNRVFAQQSDKSAVFRLIGELARPYASSPEAHFAVALAGLNTGLTDAAIAKAALEEVDRALVLRPDWDRAVLLRAEIIAKRSTADAVVYLEGAIAKSPDSRALRGALAQFLTEQKRYAEAREVYRKLYAGDASQREMQFGIAVLSVQMKDWDVAERDLLDLKKAGFGDAGQVEFYLAQVSEERGRLDEAIERYKSVPDGERAWLAKLRVGVVLAKQGKRTEARRWLGDLPAVTIEQRVQVRQTEAQIYRDANDNVAALGVIDAALKEHVDQTDLMYDRSMVLEKLDRIDEAIATLRRLVELRPDDAQSLNALGYTLVDRTPNLEEGFKLIERALQLSPADAFIMDSMGWALYRLGRLDEAEKYLSRAFFERPDPEIAAHLGEVLFAKGQPQKAREIWQSQLKATPDHPVLLETVRRHSR